MAASLSVPIYIRVSSDEQVDGTSLATQQAQCRDAVAREGFVAGRVFSDEGESAKTADRPQFLALLDYVEKERPPAVVVWKCDRFARNMLDAQIVRARLNKSGCRLISATEPIGDDPSGKFMFDMLSAVAEYDNRLRAERSRIGMSARVKAGCWLHSPPLGYRIARTADGQPSLDADPSTAPLVQRLFSLVAEGLSQADALERVTRDGLRTRTGKPVSRQTIGDLLTRPVYIGRLSGRLADSNGVGQAAGNWRGIVDAKTWNEVQKRIRTTTRTPRTRDEFPLKGKIVCAECGRPLTASFSVGRGGVKHGYYHCAKCANVRVRIADVDELLLETLAGVAMDEVMLSSLEATIEDTLQREWAGLKKKKAAATRRTAELNAKLDRLIEMRADARGRPLMLQRLDQKIAGVEADLQDALSDVGTAAGNTFDYLAEFRRAKELLHDPAGWWGKAGPAERVRAWPLFFDGKLQVKANGRVTKKGWNRLATVPTCQFWYPHPYHLGTGTPSFILEWLKLHNQLVG